MVIEAGPQQFAKEPENGANEAPLFLDKEPVFPVDETILDPEIVAQREKLPHYYQRFKNGEITIEQLKNGHQ